ncbi:anhydro-N-acetylmuramic acid kinase [Flavobacterium sp. XGLA_31]|uniref:anhydro-N-acetylmuramic acid kinase n=1 Tax=Flavobacterium sp. XGLA_31 TaxID=3447666 RepID=UPI003F31D167
MATASYHVIGVMSGTSLDGIDLAEIHFSVNSGKWQFTMGHCATVPYDDKWVQQLKTAVDFSPAQLKQLNKDYTQLLGNTIRSFIHKHRIKNLDAVCSHGHTILHQPQNGLTLQIGNLRNIATLVGEKVVCDFRVQDVKLGGQGAPLVPIGDRILFAEYNYCLNLGGFSNISFEQNGQRIAFDISPVNTVLNYYAHEAGLPYDDKGQMARSGKTDLNLLEELDALSYYQKPYPKSLGFEFVKTRILPLIESYPLSREDKMHTFVRHIAKQTALALPDRSGKLLITGGGAYNTFLLDCLKDYLPSMTLVVPDSKTIEYKEALIFALLGVLKLRKQINVLSSVTGAQHDHSSGKIFKVNLS